jgi:Na+-translocating ferredoxin:NAD+ oxidoreductase RNF subunit RnfB
MKFMIQKFGPGKQNTDYCRFKHECGFKTCLAYAINAGKQGQLLNKCPDYERFQKRYEKTIILDN